MRTDLCSHTIEPSARSRKPVGLSFTGRDRPRDSFSNGKKKKKLKNYHNNLNKPNQLPDSRNSNFISASPSTDLVNARARARFEILLLLHCSAQCTDCNTGIRLNGVIIIIYSFVQIIGYRLLSNNEN